MAGKSRRGQGEVGLRLDSPQKCTRGALCAHTLCLYADVFCAHETSYHLLPLSGSLAHCTRGSKRSTMRAKDDASLPKEEGK